MSPKNKWFLIAFTITLVADQVTKTMIVDRLHYGERLQVIPGFFDLTHVRNPGGAFSFFADGPAEWRFALFVGAAVVAMILLLVFLRRHAPQDRLSPMALGLILGGAVGNLIDRVVYGEVIDFLVVHLLFGYTWPTFNVADSAIVVGVGILLVEMFFGTEPDQSNSQSSVATP